MAIGTTAALIGAGGAVASSLLGGIGSLIGTSSTNQQQIALMREQQQWQEKMMDKQNEYNAPVNQLGLYQAAGYNPLTALNNMSGVSSSAGVQGVSTPQLQAPDLQTPFSQISNHIMNYALMESQIKKNEADAGFTRAQQETEDAIREWKVKAQENEALLSEERRNEIKAMIDKIKADTDISKSALILNEQQQQLNDIALFYAVQMNQAQLNESIARYEKLLEDKKLSAAQKEYYLEQKKTLKSVQALNYAKANEANANANEANANATYIAGAKTDNTVASTENIKASTGNIQQDTKLKEKQTDLTGHNAQIQGARVQYAADAAYWEVQESMGRTFNNVMSGVHHGTGALKDVSDMIPVVSLLK